MLVVDRRRSAAALTVNVALNTCVDLSDHMYGDKDTWALSWRATHTPHGMCPFYPSLVGRDAQPALVIGRQYITERDSAPVQYNGIV